MSALKTLCVILALVAASAGAVAQPPAAQQPALSRLDRERGLSMLKQFRKDIEKHYYDAAFRGVDIAAKFAAAEEMMRNAKTLNEVYAILTDASMALDDSHTYFIPPGRSAVVEYGWRMAAIGNDAYVVAVTRGSDADKKGLARGDRVITLNRFQPTRKNLWQINYLYRIVRPQQLQRVTVGKPEGTEKVLDIMSKVTPVRNLQLVDLLNDFDDELRAEAQRIIRLGDLVVWRMPTFGDPDDVQEAARRARDAKAIVLDLRGNGGGYVDTLVRMAGWFFDREIVLAAMKERRKEEVLKAKPQKNPLRSPLVVLVDSESGSAAEMFARIVQIEKRGTVIGDRTAGAVMTGRVEAHSLGVDTMTYYATSVTMADVRMSDGGSLEKVGVTPDELLLPVPADLAANRDPVLARAIAAAGGSITPEAAGKLYGPPDASGARQRQAPHQPR